MLIDARGQILQFRGATGSYLEPPRGRASFDLLKMAREGLTLPLRAAINKAKKDNAVARRDHVRVQENGRIRTVNVRVVPLKHVRERCFLVVFEDAGKTGASISARPSGAAKARRPATAQESRRVAELERDLADTRDYLQSIQEQYEVGNEELQASNEEVQSTNEELQSLNEELETSKEELESANEELTTINDEMVNRNAELTRLNADWLNLQTSSNLPVVVLGRDLTIRRFTGPAERLFGLQGAAVGQPIGSIQHNLMWDGRGGTQAEHREPEREPEVEAGSEGSAPEAGDVPFDVESVVADVIATVRAREFQVRAPGDEWYSVHVRPYMTLDSKIDGVILLLMKITELKRSQREADQAREYAEAIIETGREPLIVLDGSLRVQRANRAFYRTFMVAPDQTVGHVLYELGNHQWDVPELRRLLDDILLHQTTITDFSVTHSFEQLGLRTMLLNARRLEGSVQGKSSRIVLAIEDITEHQRTEADSREFMAELETKVTDRSSELVVLQKRLRALATDLNLTEQRERQRLATDLHDYLAQLLALSKINLDQIKKRDQGHLFLTEIDEVGEFLEQALDYTRSLVAQLSPPLMREFGLPSALQWLVEQMRLRGLHVTLEMEGGPLSLTEDYAILALQSVRELLINVLKHAGTNQARLRMITEKVTVRIEVSDEGSGFDVDALEAAADGKHTTAVPHFGLFNIRERMITLGGQVQLVSRPGEGTQVILIVPLADSEQRPMRSKPADFSRSTAHASPPADQSNAKVRVLLVDDHAMVRQGLRSILESYPDIEVVGEASDGEEAVAAADHLRPTVVLMDISLPKLNGIAATAQIKARYPAAVVIGLSVQTDSTTQAEMLRAGAATLLSKEAAAEELHRTIHQVLESHPS